MIYRQAVAMLPRKNAARHRPGWGHLASGRCWHRCLPSGGGIQLPHLPDLPERGNTAGLLHSYGGFNLFASLRDLADLLENYGGHELAAGFTHRQRQD